MIVPLFPVLEISALYCNNYDEGRFPRAREMALRNALRERAILYSDLPASSPDFLTRFRSGLRVLASPSGRIRPSPLEDLDQWEQVLGGPIAAEVAAHGSEVETLLLPCFQANQQLQVVDPYLAPGDCKCRAVACTCGSESRSDKDQSVRALLEWAGRPGESRVESVQVATSTRRWKESPQEADAIAIGRWLLDYASSKISPPSPLSELIWRLFPRQSARVHDRFLGFSTQGRKGDPPVNADPPWHALSIGYGVRALRSDSEGHTCLARISETQFKDVLERAERHYTWDVLVQRDSYSESEPPEWRELPEHRQASGDWRLQVRRRVRPGAAW